jgi:dinuclear metal center YbgI/SA1388 family protein
MTCLVRDIVAIMDEIAPPACAEEWDRVGLQVGSPQWETAAVLVSLAATVEVVDEARRKGAGLIVCHHPPLFRPLSRLLVDEPLGSLLQRALVDRVAIFAAHTNLDAAELGVSARLAELLELKDPAPLVSPALAARLKLVTFVPPEHAERVSAALFEAGAGKIGDYGGCSFRVEGTGTFIPGPSSKPAVGEVGKYNQMGEVRLEVVADEAELEGILEALRENHPYEEPACDVYPVRTPVAFALGREGGLPRPLEVRELARLCSRLLENPGVRWGGDPRAVVERVAVCGGSGGEMVEAALRAGAQALVTGDVGYHQARDAVDRGLAIIDAGHYHTERPMVTRLASLLREKAGERGLEVEILASHARTNPWNDGGDD